MEQTSTDNVLSETSVRNDSSVSELVPRKEVDPSEINHAHYRFAYDLVEKVLKIRGELNHDIRHNLPEPSHYLFTEEHESIVESLLLTNTSVLLLNIHQHVNGIYDSRNYLACRDFSVAMWQTKAYTEKSFITACATLAYVAAHFTQKNYHCGALDDIVVYIARWIGDIHSGGTIEHSCC